MQVILFTSFENDTRYQKFFGNKYTTIDHVSRGVGDSHDSLSMNILKWNSSEGRAFKNEQDNIPENLVTKWKVVSPEVTLKLQEWKNNVKSLYSIIPGNNEADKVIILKNITIMLWKRQS